MQRRLIISIALGSVLLAGLLWRLADHDLSWRQSEPFNFFAVGDSITGTLWLPSNTTHAAIVFVHGDGPQDRLAWGGNPPLFNTLLDHGIAVAAWDKPGVGDSGGDWLSNSMAERAEIVQAALLQLKERFPDISVGALGVSQAGWVLPKLDNETADFIVLIGAAVSWQEQGKYYARIRLGAQGLSEAEIEKEIERIALMDKEIFSKPMAPKDGLNGMSSGRWGFVRRNLNSDSSPELAQLSTPLFAVWGEDDLNTDAATEAANYTALLNPVDDQTQILIYPNATHGLLKSGAYNYQLSEQWPFYTKLRFLAEGRYAYAPGAVDKIADWIRRQD